MVIFNFPYTVVKYNDCGTHLRSGQVVFLPGTPCSEINTLWKCHPGKALVFINALICPRPYSRVVEAPRAQLPVAAQGRRGEGLTARHLILYEEPLAAGVGVGLLTDPKDAAVEVEKGRGGGGMSARVRRGEQRATVRRTSFGRS